MASHRSAAMLAISAALLALSVAETTGTDGKAVGTGGKTVVCYWQSWSHKRPAPHTYTVDDIPVHLCTHVIYSYAKLDNRTSSLYLDKTFDAGKDGYIRFLGLRKRNPKVKLLLALGDRYGSDNAAWQEAVHDPSRRYHVVTMVYRLLREYNFDGVHINWEIANGNEDSGTDNAFVKFAWQIQRTFKRHTNFIMSCVIVLPKQKAVYSFLPELVPYVDFFHASVRSVSTGIIGTSNSTHRNKGALSTPLSHTDIRRSLQYLLGAGLPHEKLLLEVPFSGLEVRSSLEPSKEHNDENHDIIPYFKVCMMLRSGAPSKWDEQRLLSYLLLGDGQRVFYDDADSVRRKGEPTIGTWKEWEAFPALPDLDTQLRWVKQDASTMASRSLTHARNGRSVRWPSALE
ncbi:probable chitinase 2 isoform X4 [Dermacentor andersoni]|uniref:probable chitinase 2 isoform X4 n=1 Tax=Dermacentor andersoni TaxID=34620 RepID=UPI003B3ACAB4